MANKFAGKVAVITGGSTGMAGSANPTIARAVSFLASGEASYVNGVELFVDGGVAQI